MLSYKDILNNEYIKNEYKKIDEINPYAFSHGLQHINNVCEIINNLCDILKIDKEMRDALLIAGASHDVGQYESRDNHGLKAKMIIQELFDNELKENKYYSDILYSIEVHDKKNDKEDSLFALLLKCADSLDFSKKRLEPNHSDLSLYRPWEDIEDVIISVSDNEFIINIISNGNKTFKNNFIKEKFTRKIISSVKNLAKKLKLIPIIKIDDSPLNLDNYIIIHGSFGSKDGNWFPWLKEKLEEKNLIVDVPQMPIGVGIQCFESWSKVLDKIKVDDNTTIIAHSIAPIFVCKYLITNKIKVKRLIFVCGFNNYLGINEEFDAVNKPMFINNLEEIKKYCNDIICYYSDNDPYVKYEVEKDFAYAVTNKQYVIHNGGHINSESGYTKFEDILRIL